MASEEMSFENVDDGWQTDDWLYYKLTYEPSPTPTSHAIADARKCMQLRKTWNVIKYIWHKEEPLYNANFGVQHSMWIVL